MVKVGIKTSIKIQPCTILFSFLPLSYIGFFSSAFFLLFFSFLFFAIILLSLNYFDKWLFP